MKPNKAHIAREVRSFADALERHAAALRRTAYEVEDDSIIDGTYLVEELITTLHKVNDSAPLVTLVRIVHAASRG